MIIIKIIILYFIQIRHTDDFPSTGTRLVCIINVTYFFYIPKTVFVTVVVAMVICFAGREVIDTTVINSR